MKTLNYGTLNRVIAKVISSMTAALRFDGELNVDMNEFQTNLVPFPRLHFMTTSLSPLVTAESKGRKQNDCWTITVDALDDKFFLVKYTDFDVVEDKYMAISINYRGKIVSKESNETVQKIKQQNKVSFVEWMPTGSLVKVWKKVNSLKLVKILDFWRRITWMLSLSKLLMKKRIILVTQNSKEASSLRKFMPRMTILASIPAITVCLLFEV